MRIEVLGSRDQERARKATRTDSSQSDRRICGELVSPALCAPVTGREVRMPVATGHAVNTETIKRMTIRLRQWDALHLDARPRRVAPSPLTA